MDTQNEIQVLETTEIINDNENINTNQNENINTNQNGMTNLGKITKSRQIEDLSTNNTKPSTVSQSVKGGKNSKSTVKSKNNDDGK